MSLTTKSPNALPGFVFEKPSSIFLPLKVIASYALLFAFASAGNCNAAPIRLQQSFIERYADRVTITADFVIEHAHRKPNKPIDDGDLHFAGKSVNIRLPTVAEIMNAAEEPAAMGVVHRLEGTDRSVRVTGVWRLWAEHPDRAGQVQGAVFPVAVDTNPKHVFEIHPITNIDRVSATRSLHPILGYSPTKAKKAFDHYENRRCKIVPALQTTIIDTPKAIYNYAEFRIKVPANFQKLVDGKRVEATVLDLNGKVLVPKRAMVFANGTPPEAALRRLPPDRVLHVLGIPRVSLQSIKQVSETLNNSPENRVAARKLPYEMIIVGIYPEAE
jgi:hypothetical protein